MPTDGGRTRRPQLSPTWTVLAGRRPPGHLQRRWMNPEVNSGSHATITVTLGACTRRLTIQQGVKIAGCCARRHF